MVKCLLKQCRVRKDAKAKYSVVVTLEQQYTHKEKVSKLLYCFREFE